MYYTSCFEKYKNYDIKGTCSVIKDILNKSKQKQIFFWYFQINGKLINDKSPIANKFNF